jgi:type IV pilus assembly protein PilO
MMKKPKLPEIPKMNIPKIDFKEIAEDFKTLDPKDPGAWPLIPKIIILVGIFAALVLMAGWFGWQGQLEELDTKRQEEVKLKEDWLKKKKEAINLDEYRNQLAEIERSFGALLRQLPNASEMESLLVDVNQAGLGRGLQFELFKPSAEVARDFYAELPITIKITGTYHDLGAFASDVAKLPRIVTLNNIDVKPADKSAEKLEMSTQARTFRYLGEEELAAKRKAKGAKK